MSFKPFLLHYSKMSMKGSYNNMVAIIKFDLRNKRITKHNLISKSGNCVYF